MPVELHYSACALNCPDLCAYVVEVEDGRVVRLRGDEKHSYTLGRCCPKGYAHVLRMYSEDRLLHPLRRQSDGTFARISWDEALNEIADRMREARDQHGPLSVGLYSGSGNDGMAPKYMARFANLFGTPMIPGIAEICFEGAYEGMRFTVGPFPPHELSDWTNSRCIVIWGTNKHESGIHTKRVIEEAREQGAKLIVIDPRKTPHTKQADIYTTIRPGADAALALGVANEIIRRDLYDHDFVEQYVHGFDQYRERVTRYDRKTVSELTWVPENVIEDIAVMFATHGPALITSAPAGMNHYTNGSSTARAVHSLLAICGYLGVPGGGFQYLSSDHSPFNNPAVTLSTVSASNPRRPIVPSATYLPDLILSSTESPLRVLVIQAANPITQWPNANKTREALKKIPFKVCIDLELTDTARLCDIVLPATFIFEHDNLVHSEIHRVVQFAPKIVEPRGEARSEFDIWRELAEHFGLGSKYGSSQMDLIQLALTSEACKNMTVEKLRSNPEGLRTASEAIPFRDRVFGTPTGKVELFSILLEEMGEDPLPDHIEPEESPFSTPDVFSEFPLIMITGRSRTRLHSQYTTVSVSGRVKSFAHCTTCQECVKKCPDEAISLTAPSPRDMLNAADEALDSRAPRRRDLGNLIGSLAVRVSEKVVSVPLESTGLLMPVWDSERCIGCRDCELDHCPFNVITETIRMPSRSDTGAEKRAVLRMHPKTASELGLRSGDSVCVESRRGRVDPMVLETTEDIDERVVWSSDGHWDQDGNVNNLTDDRHTAFGHTPGFNSVLVRVTKSRGGAL